MKCTSELKEHNWCYKQSYSNSVLGLFCSPFPFSLPSVIDLLHPCSLYHFECLDLSFKIPRRLVVEVSLILFNFFEILQNLSPV